MRAREFIIEANVDPDSIPAWTRYAHSGRFGMTPLGMKYEKLYLNYYKKRFAVYRKQGMSVEDATQAAQKDLDKYKDRVRRGEYDPIVKTRW